MRDWGDHPMRWWTWGLAGLLAGEVKAGNHTRGLGMWPQAMWFSLLGMTVTEQRCQLLGTVSTFGQCEVVKEAAIGAWG